VEKQLNLFDEFDHPSYLIHSEVFPDAESEEVEYKLAQGGFPQDFWKTYSAFANTQGGIIVLGIGEKKGRFSIDGLSAVQIEKYQKDFWSGANNRNTISFNLLANNDVKEYELQGKKVLAFHIPPADRKVKPIYLTHNPLGHTYKRNFEGDYVCRDEEVKRMLADADTSYSPDSRLLTGYTIEDIDQASLKQYRQLLSVVRPSHPWLTLDDISFLTQLGGYRKDRKTGKEGFTVAGILMFGKYLSIADEECCPKFFPDYRELHSDAVDIRWTDRIYPDGTWECNLFQFYRLVYPKLSSRLPKPFQIEKGLRIDDTLAHTALREAFVNTLVHADYNAPGNIIIESRPEMFSFTNPGTLLVTLHQYYTGGISECRNTQVQKMFLLIGGAEKAGSGVDKIMSGWVASHWRRPYVVLDSEPDRILLEMPLFSVLPQDTLESLKRIFGAVVETLGKDELTVLSVSEIEGEVSNAKLQYYLDLHRTDITRLLQDLCKRGFLTMESKNRWTTYRLNAQFAKNEDSLNEDSLNVDTSKNEDSLNVDTSKNEDTSNEDTSKNEDTLNEDTSRSKDSSEILSSLIHKSVSESKLGKEIRRICQDEYTSIEEIANRANRSVRHLKNRILPKMLIEGTLVKMHPQKNHPQQKYITKGKSN
jgi:predicted HTH transcriptional regulator